MINKLNIVDKNDNKLNKQTKLNDKTSSNKPTFFKKNYRYLFWVFFIIIFGVIVWALFFRSTSKYINKTSFIYYMQLIQSEDSSSRKNSDYVKSLTFTRDNNGNFLVTAHDLQIQSIPDDPQPGFPSKPTSDLPKLKDGTYETVLTYEEGVWFSSSQVPSSNNNTGGFITPGWSYTGSFSYGSDEKTGQAYAVTDNINVSRSSNANFYLQLIFSLLPIIIIIILFYLVYRSFSKGKGGGGLGIPFKKPAPKPVTSNIKFRDVAGYKEEKYELEEVIDYLKRPNSYNSMGVRIPKGVLLVGEPGTGKTLLARAVAGESSVPFLKINGSEFVELFVGVGAQRVRDLFNTAKKYAPSILFIDEIDTIGRKRGSSLGGSNDEREQTLNQLLVELDGFSNRENVIVIGATNRVDVLDSALLRPGRFDRIIQFHTPTVDERVSILKVHAENKNLDPDIDLKQIATRTPGFTGAQLENVLNEAALLSIREHEKMVTLQNIDEAIDRVIGGLAKKSKKYIEKEKQLVSYHESGHAVCGLVLDGADKIQKITIIPRGKAGGYTLMTPKEERFFATKTEIYEKITGYLGGRAAEEIIFGAAEITTGAHNDIEQATNLARKMVTELGMTDLGMVKYDNLINAQNPYFEGTVKTSEKIAALIDEKIKEIIDTCYTKSLKIIKTNKQLLKLLATALMSQETINEEEIAYIKKNMKLPEHITNPKKHTIDLEKIQKKHEKKKKIEIDPN